MDVLKKNLQLLREGMDDSLDILGDDEMSMLTGGDTNCKRDYSYKNDTISCGCGYTSNATDEPTGDPTNEPTPEE